MTDESLSCSCSQVICVINEGDCFRAVWNDSFSHVMHFVLPESVFFFK